MKRRPADEEELNLIPIMNLVTLLIPFLLMSAQFVSYSMIESTLPEICSGSDCGDADDPAVAVRLLVSRDAYQIEATGSGFEDLDAGLHIPCPGGACDEATATLREHLTRLKDAHPNLDHLVLVPDGKVDYATLILAMDTTREDPDAAGMPGEHCDGRCLFPQITVAGGVGG